jgi:hypothetical protein
MENQVMTIPDDVALRAAIWWFDQMDGEGASMGGGTLNSAFYDASRRESAAENAPQKSQRDTFVAALIDEIKAEPARRAVTGQRIVSQVVVTVDYEPDDMLAKACEIAGIDAVALPPKTTMWIDANGIRAKRGYGSQITPVI